MRPQERKRAASLAAPFCQGHCQKSDARIFRLKFLRQERNCPLCRRTQQSGSTPKRCNNLTHLDLLLNINERYVHALRHGSPDATGNGPGELTGRERADKDGPRPQSSMPAFSQLWRGCGISLVTYCRFSSVSS